MVLRYLRNTEIDRAAWNRLMAESPNAVLYAQAWYLDAVADQWDALVQGNYEAVMPLVWNRKWGLKSIYPPLLSQQLGVFSRKTIDKAQFESFIGQIPWYYWKVRLRLNKANDFKPSGWNRSVWKNMVLDLDASYEDLLINYSSNCKRNLKKAKAVQTQTIQQEECFEKALAVFKEGRGHKMEALFFSSLLRVMKKSHMLGIGALWTVRDDTQDLLAAVFIVESNGRLYNLLQALTQKGKEARSSFLLTNAIIEAHAGQKKKFDFEGSMDAGVCRFYQGFGAVDEPYWEINKSILSI